MKIICNSLYQHLIDPKYYEEVSFLDNDACEHQGEGYDLSEVEMAVMQPFYFNKEFLDKMPPPPLLPSKLILLLIICAPFMKMFESLTISPPPWSPVSILF